MKKKLLLIAFIYTIIMVIAGQLILSHINIVMQKQAEEQQAMQNLSVEVNEVKQLILSGETQAALDKCEELIGTSTDTIKTDSNVVLLMWIFVALNIIAMAIVLVYVYIRILKPFEDMKKYAGEIAAGNLDVSLKMDRGNYFGDFTWAFENMRKEIIKSRNSEKTAIENNKTVIATLSHDIKTPVASIRAYSEAFEANMDKTPEKRQKYLSVLMDKCDEVSKLTNDLFLHSISEMDRLDINKESFDIVSFMDTEVRKLFVDDNEVDIILPVQGDSATGDLASVMVNLDSKRLLQIIENLKSNADKYAGTKVEISLELADVVATAGDGTKLDSKLNSDSESRAKDTESNQIRIHFRDFGPGISEDEIPFITGKFYRGKNKGDANGSGLGLYIVKELVDKMNGQLMILNRNPGLEAIISFN